MLCLYQIVCINWLLYRPRWNLVYPLILYKSDCKAIKRSDGFCHLTKKGFALYVFMHKKLVQRFEYKWDRSCTHWHWPDRVCEDIRHQIVPSADRNFTNWGAAGVILEKREMYKTVFISTFKGRVWVFRAQELCGSRGGRPNKSYGFCGCKATLNRAGWVFLLVFLVVVVFVFFWVGGWWLTGLWTSTRSDISESDVWKCRQKTFAKSRRLFNVCMQFVQAYLCNYYMP